MTIYVPQKTYLTVNCFNTSSTVVNVDCSNTPWENNTMYGAFFRCSNLKTCKSIPDSIVNMRSAFQDCTNLVSAPNIPSAATDINSCFYNCSSLTTAPDMSNATHMSNMRSAFAYCTQLQTVPSFPPTANNAEYCFTNCTYLTTVANVIPNNITNVEYMFGNCTHLGTVNLFFPSSVVNMSGTFLRCNDMSGNVYIYSTEAAHASFPASSQLTYQRRNVYIPFKYDNGVYTKIYNSYNSYYGVSSSGQYYNLYIQDLKSLRYWNTNLNPWYDGPLVTTPMYSWDFYTQMRIATETQTPTTSDTIYIVTDYGDGTYSTQDWWTSAIPDGNIAAIQTANVNSVSVSGTSLTLKLKTGPRSTSSWTFTRNSSADFGHLFS